MELEFDTIFMLMRFGRLMQNRGVKWSGGVDATGEVNVEIERVV